MMSDGCALFEEEKMIYLKNVKGLHVTQAEAEQPLGVPDAIQSLSNGEITRRYQIWTNTGGDLNWSGDSGA